MAYHSRVDLVGLIRSTTYLIQRVVFRPTGHIGRSETFFLRIRPLGELVDMYHTREASDPRDKIYALLGMSSDRQNYAQLSADYTIPWKDLLQQLVRLLVTSNVAVATWDNEEIAVIKGKGSIVGEIISINSSPAIQGKLQVDVLLKAVPGREDQVAKRTLQPFAKSVQIGDLICILEGAPRPAIVRPLADYCAVIAISITPMKFGFPKSEIKSNNVGWRDLVNSTGEFPHDLLLVWDWRMLNKTPGAEKKDYASFISSRLPNHGSLDSQNRVDFSTQAKRAREVMEGVHTWRGRTRQDRYGDQQKGLEERIKELGEDNTTLGAKNQELGGQLLALSSESMGLKEQLKQALDVCQGKEDEIRSWRSMYMMLPKSTGEPGKALSQLAKRLAQYNKLLADIMRDED